MGAKQSVPTLDPDKLDDYVDLTFFSKTQILRAWARFNEYNKDQDDTLTRDELLSMPELAINPLRERVAHVFSRDGTGTMTFDDFLDFLSVFNPKASLDLKSSYAFRIYDIDGDGFLGRDDLREVVRLLTGQAFAQDESEALVNNIMQECDLDGDERISFIEFDYVVKRAPDFVRCVADPCAAQGGHGAGAAKDP